MAVCSVGRRRLQRRGAQDAVGNRPTHASTTATHALLAALDLEPAASVDHIRLQLQRWVLLVL